MADSDTMTIKNESDQIVSFTFNGPNDPRRQLVEQRVARGEWTKASDGDEAGSFVAISDRVVEDYHTGLRDEKGDWLRSVHGGGVDPDALGDAAGQPSGSIHVDGMIPKENEKIPVGDSNPAVAAIETPKELAEKGGVDPSLGEDKAGDGKPAKRTPKS